MAVSCCTRCLAVEHSVADSSFENYLRKVVGIDPAKLRK
jgi:hypothetical protein